MHPLSINDTVAQQGTVLGTLNAQSLSVRQLNACRFSNNTINNSTKLSASDTWSATLKNERHILDAVGPLMQR